MLKTSSLWRLRLNMYEAYWTSIFLSLVLTPEIMRVLMKALAMNVAQAPTYETLMKDMSYGDEGVSISAPTLKRYVDELKSLYLIDD